MYKTPAIVVGAAAMLAGPMLERAEAAPPVKCPGEVTLVSQSNVAVTARGERTLTEFDYTARHTLCLRDGTVVDDALQEGHLWMNQRTDGSGTVHFVSTVSHGDGTLIGIGRGHIDADGIISGRAWVPGGTGSLAGTTGHGWFRSTGQGTFEDVIWYQFH